MPTWLINQLQKAYAEKNEYQIKILNQCWFYYQKKAEQEAKQNKE
ncbi:cortex morphogenetic protein CmpA [Alkalihalobacillus trypoxylicola]|nr:cortex morphogenetic protein CmpA [Alkalihalobacillus trypoxylicola]